MTECTKATDDRLVRETLAGKQEAFSLLVERYHPAMHALAFAQTGNHADADDVAQEGFLKAYRSLNGLRDARKFGGWLAAIVRNKARSLVRQRQQRAEVAIAPDSAAAPPEVETRELRALLKAQIEQLDEKHREVLLLHYFADMNAREIGGVLGLSKFAVQKRLQRAREVLGGKVVDLLGSEAEHRHSAAERRQRIMGLIAAMPLPWAVSSAQAATTILGVPALAFKLAVASVVAASAIVAVGAFIGLPRADTSPPESTATQEQIDWLAANSGMSNNPMAETADATAPGIPPSNTMEKPDITGVAIDVETGQGVPDIPIRLSAEGTPHGIVLNTDTNGHFAFTEVPAGDYVVVADRGLYILTGGEPGLAIMGEIGLPIICVRVGTDEPVPSLRLEVTRGGVVAGRVLDATTKAPVPGIRLHAALMFGRGWTDLGTLPRTDENGTFRIEGLPAREYKILCSWKTYRTDPMKAPTVQITKPGETQNVADIFVEYGLPVAGRVVDQSGNPVEDAIVWGRWRNANDLRIQTAKSDATGAFELKGGGYRSGGRLFVQAYKGADLSMIDGPKTISEGGLGGIVLTLAPGASIAGVVTDASGRPLADATVTAAYEPDRLAEMAANDDHIPPGSLGFGKDTRTGPDGSYRVEGLHPGNYGTHVTAPGEKPADHFTMSVLKRVYVEPGQALTGVNLVIGQPQVDGPVISGTIRDASGQPLAQVRVTAFSPTGFPAQPVQTDERGVYRFGGLQGGPFTIRAEQAGFSPASAEGIEIGASNVDLMLLPSGSVEGQVVRADNGAPVTEFEIATINRITDDFSNVKESFKPVSDSQGRFRLDDLGAGSHTIFVKARGSVMGSLAIESLQPSEVLSYVVVPLEAADPISGIVVTDAGAPVSNAMILTPYSRIDFARQGQETPETTTDSEGRFTLDTLVPNLQRLIAVHRDFAPEIVEVPTSGPERRALRIVLKSGGSIEGTVAGIDEVAPGARVHVRVWYPEEPEKGPIDIPCEPDGTYSHRKLAPGIVELTASTVLREPSLGIKKAIAIAEGETVVADFDFEPFSASVEGYVKGAGESWSRARIMASSSSEDGATCSVDVEVKPDGYYKVEGLPAGPATLTLRATGGDDVGFSKELEVNVIDGEAVEVNFEP